MIEKVLNTVKHYDFKLVVLSISETDDKYIVEAVYDPNAKNYNDPFYAVDKDSGRIYPWNPIRDRKGFLNARRIYSRE